MTDHTTLIEELLAAAQEVEAGLGLKDCEQTAALMFSAASALATSHAVEQRLMGALVILDRHVPESVMVAMPVADYRRLKEALTLPSTGDQR